MTQNTQLKLFFVAGGIALHVFNQEMMAEVSPTIDGSPFGRQLIFAESKQQAIEAVQHTRVRCIGITAKEQLGKEIIDADIIGWNNGKVTGAAGRTFEDICEEVNNWREEADFGTGTDNNILVFGDGILDDHMDLVNDCIDSLNNRGETRNSPAFANAVAFLYVATDAVAKA